MSTTRIPAGVDYCTTHHGIRNEDEAACDMAHDMPGACVLHECFCEVTVTIDGDRVRAEDIMSDTPVTPISERTIEPERLAQIRDAHDRRRGFITEVHMGLSPVGSSSWWSQAIAEMLAEIDRLTDALAERDATIAELRAAR